MQSDHDSVKSQAGEKFHAFVEEVFLKHPHEAGESYFKHLFEALKIAFTLLLAVCTAIIHGVFPKFFKTTTGDRVMKLADDIRERRKKWDGPKVHDYH